MYSLPPGAALILLLSTAAFAGRAPGLDAAIEPAPVTEADWQACVKAGACPPATEVVETERGRLVRVPYEAASGYCASLGRRLPRQDEVAALGVSVPAHPKTVIDEWVAGDAEVPHKLRPAGTRQVQSSSGGAHGLRCMWEVQAAPEPSYPDLEPCLLGRRRVGTEDVSEVRPATRGPIGDGMWTCGGLSVWVEPPDGGASWLDHWTGEIQTVVSERSDGSYAIAFRPHREAVEGEDDLWFLSAVAQDATIKRSGAARKLPLRDLEGAKRAQFKAGIPGQRETRFDALWLTHRTWDIALVVGPGRYGADPERSTTNAFFQSLAPSLVAGWRLALPGGGWASLPPTAWSPRAPVQQPDRVAASFVWLGRGIEVDIEARRLLGQCPAGPTGPSEAGISSEGSESLSGWKADIFKVADPAGPRWIAVGCPSGVHARVELRGGSASRDLLLEIARDVSFP